MNHSSRPLRPLLATLTGAALLTTPLGVATATAAEATAGSAADPAPSRITLHRADGTVDPGEQFVLRGRFLSRGEPVAGVPVKVRTYRDGGWRDLAGARVTTNRHGRYRVRVILFSGGDRDLRVVGNPHGDRIRTARNETVVRVLG